MSISGHGAGYFDVKYKIMVLGESKVDKTQLIKRYTKDQFGGVYLTTVGMDFQDKIIEIEDKKVRLQIWDTAGQERFRNVTKSYFQSFQGFVLVYDIANKRSFESLYFWMDQIKLNGPENVKTILVGNNCDLINERQVSFEEGENFAKKYNIKFFEASAKDGTNVNELFFYIANEIYQENKENKANKILEKKGLERFVEENNFNLKKNSKLLKYLNF